MDEAAYTEMTYGYPMAALHALKEAGVAEGRTEENPFRFVYISGEHADPTGESSRMWARVKGKAEVDITAFCNSTPGMEAHIFRPGYFFPSPAYPEDRKHQRGLIANLFDYIATPLGRWFAPSLLTPTEELGLFAIELAKGRFPDQKMYRNAEMRRLVQEL